jgi:hypothetical protein
MNPCWREPDYRVYRYPYEFAELNQEAAVIMAENFPPWHKRLYDQMPFS